MDRVRKHFRPEYLNRLDEIIIFHSLLKEHIREIVSLQTARLAERVENAAGIQLVFTDAVLDHIADEGFDPTYGARPIKRFIQREIENPLASEMLSRKLPEKVTVDFDGEKVLFRTA
jgi:ATP-dependent Clp protease ATP-binding subunit ClpB